jgi:hypothetical protein
MSVTHANERTNDELMNQNDKSTDPKALSNFFRQFDGMFGSAATGGTSCQNKGQEKRPDAENVFADVFDKVRIYLGGYSLVFAESGQASSPRSRTTRALVVIRWGCVWWRRANRYYEVV